MSVARTGALPNTYKYVTIAVNGFEQKRMEGLVGHVSQTGAAPFHNATQLVHIFNHLFKQIRYPMSTVDLRQFDGRSINSNADCSVGFSGTVGGTPLKGKLATFRIHVKYRYHATWQGNVTWQESGITYAFESFLQLMKIFDQVLGDGVPKVPHMGKQMCEVLVQNYEDSVLSGDVSHPAVEERMAFANEFEMMEQMEAMLLPAGLPAQEMVIVPRKPGTGEGALTFVVRLMFNGNATWQGTVGWKENGVQEHFRSFLELLMMMDEAAGRIIGREGETSGGAGKNAS